MTVACPKCHGGTWFAIGTFNESRKGLRRALLRCTACGYAFASGQADALAAGEEAHAGDAVPMPPAASKQPLLPRSGVRQYFTTARQLATNWKRKQAKDDVA